jgi:hypothetical protein
LPTYAAPSDFALLVLVRGSHTTTTASALRSSAWMATPNYLSNARSAAVLGCPKTLALKIPLRVKTSNRLTTITCYQLLFGPFSGPSADFARCIGVIPTQPMFQFPLMERCDGFWNSRFEEFDSVLNAAGILPKNTRYEFSNCTAMNAELVSQKEVIE